MADKDISKEPSSSEYASETSDPDYEERPASLFGTLRTRLNWQPSSRTMHLDVRQTLQNRRNLEFRYKAKLNTSSGGYTQLVQMQKNMNQNTPSMARIIAAERGIQLEGEEPLSPDKLLPGGIKCLLLRDWTLSPGVRLRRSSSSSSEAAGSSSSSSDGDLKYYVTLRKQPQVLRRQGVWDSWLTGKADLELDAQQQQVALRGSLRLKAFRFNVTDKQDLQAAAGLDYVAGAGAAGSSRLTPYLKVGENSWSIRLQQGLWMFNYEI